MFFPPGMTPEMITALCQQIQNKKQPTFEEYYQKRLKEEYAAFGNRRSLTSLKSMMVLSKLPEIVRLMARREYDQKYGH